MLHPPENSRIEGKGKRLNLKLFLRPEQSTAERSRLRKCLKKATLTHQLTGSSIPSIISPEIRCEAIQFLDIELTDLRHRDFAAKLIQPLLKEHAVLRLHDAQGGFALSYALKRLSKNDPGSIVISHAYTTAIHPPGAGLPQLHHTALLNRTSKHDHYMEAMVKSYLLDHPRIFLGAGALLGRKFWHHAPSVLSLFDQLQNLLSLKAQKDRAKSNAAKATLNTSIKAAIEKIRMKYEV
ncbi:DUF4391 domain-containing protein [Luteolibacter algae]|uniref:DUF4391 domain-containing protein n=1 Tax=Luteolibacter algae TaxID=454151 RepID=A0ABW5DA21_9BACT